MDMTDRLEALYGAMMTLSERERFVVRCRFGMVATREVFTLAHIGQRLGISREAIRQIEERALKKIKTAINASA